MNNQQKIIVLWFMLVVCMILHFDYHVSGIFYGIDVKRPNADGTYPPALLLIRTVFHILPMIFAVGIMFLSSKIVRILTLIAAVIYTPYHGMHLFGEFSKPHLNISQVQLLTLTVGLSAVLLIVSWNWLRELKKQD